MQAHEPKAGECARWARQCPAGAKHCTPRDNHDVADAPIPNPSPRQRPTFAMAPEVTALSLAIADSYERLLGQALVAAPRDHIAEALYAAPFALLAHDGGADPRFTYANLTAQRLWERDWEDFVGLPSRLSAEPDGRATRAQMLQQVAQSGFITDYSGVRVSASGVRFRIVDTHVWNLTDPDGMVIGQAARIETWRPVSR